MRATLYAGTALIFVLQAFAVTAEAASANSSAAGTAQPAGAGTDSGLEVVVVTAQRRSEDMQKAAVAISSVDANTLINAGVTDTQGLSNVVPALQVKSAAGPYPLFYLRGVGNFNGNGLSDSAIAFDVDGVYIGRPSSTSGFFYDLDRIEVLKGPQGTLYGRNATGGAINVITKAPELGDLGGYMIGSYGNYNAVNLQGAVNVPLGEDAAARLSGEYLKHDGYLSDGTSDENDYGLRGQVLWEPRDDLSVRIGADYFHQGGVGAGSTIIGANVGAGGQVLPSGLSRATGMNSAAAGVLFSQQLVYTAGNFLAPLPNDLFQDDQFYGVSSTIEWTTALGTLTVIPAYREGQLNYRNTVPAFLIDQREDDKQDSVEIRFASKEETPLRWLVGAYYLKEDISVPEAAYNQEFNASYQSYKSGLETEAAFGRVTWSLTDTIRLNAGLRYTAESKNINGTLYGASVLCSGTVAPGTVPPTFCFGGPYLPNTAGVAPGLVAPNGNVIPFQLYGFGTPFPGGPATTPVYLAGSQINLNKSASFSKLTWRAGAEWDVAEHSMLYASYEVGYKSGGFFFTSDNPVYRPETVDAWTVGAKNRFFDNRLQLNLEGFYWTYKDQQISHVGRDSAGIVIFATENVGRAEMKGFELEALYALGANTLLSADIQYLDANYTSFVYSVPNFGAPPLVNCAATPQGTVYVLDCSGKRPPNAPAWTINLDANHTIPLGQYKVVLDARTLYQSRTLSGFEFQNIEYQQPFWRSDASVSFGDADGTYALTLFVNNIEDQRQESVATPQPLSTIISESVTPPRTYGVRLRYNF